MTGVTGLRGLLANVTPGPWTVYAPWDRVPCVKAADEFVADECGIENARLIALCPDAVALLCDWFEKYNQHMDNEDIRRFVSLEERAR